jgi:hypothetical protein
MQFQSEAELRAKKQLQGNRTSVPRGTRGKEEAISKPKPEELKLSR